MLTAPQPRTDDAKKPHINPRPDLDTQTPRTTTDQPGDAPAMATQWPVPPTPRVVVKYVRVGPRRGDAVARPDQGVRR
ncbi:hypothetical protein N9M22_04740 [Litoricolaceae bacterium]|nr:hypothetical protein [Litorivicinaceae bacterium]